MIHIIFQLLCEKNEQIIFKTVYLPKIDRIVPNFMELLLILLTRGVCRRDTPSKVSCISHWIENQHYPLDTTKLIFC